MLKDGNARFAQGEMLKRNLRQQVKATGGGQFPFAAMVGCIGSRLPNELIFDQGMVDKVQISLAGDMYDVHNGKVTFM
jgi:carbonic anhydrase